MKYSFRGVNPQWEIVSGSSHLVDWADPQKLASVLERKYGLTQVVVEPVEDDLGNKGLVSQSDMGGSEFTDVSDTDSTTDSLRANSLVDTHLNHSFDGQMASQQTTAASAGWQFVHPQESKKEAVDGFFHHLSASLSFLFSGYFFLAVFFAQGSSESSLTLLFRSTLESNLFLCTVFGVLALFVWLHWAVFGFLEKILSVLTLFLVCLLVLCLGVVGVGGWFFFLLHVFYFPLLLLFGLFCFEEFGHRDARL